MNRWLAALLILLPQVAFARDGQHDFDPIIGTWKTHIRRLAHPLSGSTKWVEDTGLATIHPLWNGLGNLEEIEVDMPDGHLEGATLRLYNPKTQQWSLTWINAKRGVPDKPAFGDFQNGRGEFIDQESYEGRFILVRQVYSDLRPSSHHFEQSFSADRGRTWEVNLSADLTRTEPVATPLGDRQHDFDFDFGTWKAQARRIADGKWVEGTSTNSVRPIWGGRGSIEEIDFPIGSGHLLEATLRLYNPTTHQWSLTWINSKRGAPDPPMFGEFRDGRADFVDQEPDDGRMILVRQTFSDIKPDSYHFEQAFSTDNGKTWEPNLTGVLTRTAQ